MKNITDRWTRIDISLLEDPRIQKLLDSKLGFAGFGIYIALLLKLANTYTNRMTLNQLLFMSRDKAGYTRTLRVIKEFDLFWINGNNEVEPRPSVHKGVHSGVHAGSDAPEPLGLLEKKRKEINKESCNNGNIDFDPRWD